MRRLRYKKNGEKGGEMKERWVPVSLPSFGGLVAFLEYPVRFFLPIRDLGAKDNGSCRPPWSSAELIFALLDTHPSSPSPPADFSSGGMLQAEAQKKKKPPKQLLRVGYKKEPRWPTPLPADCSSVGSFRANAQPKASRRYTKGRPVFTPLPPTVARGAFQGEARRRRA